MVFQTMCNLLPCDFEAMIDIFGGILLSFSPLFRIFFSQKEMNLN